MKINATVIRGKFSVLFILVGFFLLGVISTLARHFFRG